MRVTFAFHDSHDLGRTDLANLAAARSSFLGSVPHYRAWAAPCVEVDTVSMALPKPRGLVTPAPVAWRRYPTIGTS